MLSCFFVSDLHGRPDRYDKLFDVVVAERPAAVFFGGDLLPHAALDSGAHFVRQVLAAGCRSLRTQLGDATPRVFMILGNDDPRALEPLFVEHQQLGLWEYIHAGKAQLEHHPVFGYSCVPPTPFFLKDWERYDVSRYVDPGCTPPEEGRHTVSWRQSDVRFATIARDLDDLLGDDSLSEAILLLHSPPYGYLDCAALDGQRVDGVPLDPHVGSVAIARSIEARQPLLSLHGHVHESARLTGRWRECIGRTHLFSAAHDGPELALVRFDADQPEKATRQLI
jgi:Icc-related predicted phosphoesterase